jgi:adenylylsulfate kinase-like enzyme
MAYVDSPIGIWKQRDSKSLFARARRGEIIDSTGVDDPYEPPRQPDITLTNIGHTPNKNAKRSSSAWRSAAF